MIGLKTCTICKKEKLCTDFNKDKNKSDGLEHRCRDCALSIGRKYREMRKRLGHKYVVRDPNRKRVLSKEWALKNPERVKAKFRKYWLNKKYGLTQHKYFEMIRNQGFCCFICKAHESDFVKGLAVDHCHKTGKVRKLICPNCNRGLGSFKDNEFILKKAIMYLRSAASN